MRSWWDAVPLVAVPGLAAAGWAINRHCDAGLLRQQVAAAAGALAAAIALAQAWKNSPERMLRGSVLAVLAAGSVGVVALG